MSPPIEPSTPRPRPPGAWPRRRSLRALAALLLVGVPLLARAELRTGDPFPSLAATRLSGPQLPATAGKVLLVDFWASWCAPCKASFPAYASLQQDYRGRGLMIVAVSVDESLSAYTAFVARFRPPFAAPRDEGQQLVSRVHVPTMPTCYLVGRDGRVRFIHQGFHGDATERELHQEIDALLAEPDHAP